MRSFVLCLAVATIWTSQLAAQHFSYGYEPRQLSYPFGQWEMSGVPARRLTPGEVHRGVTLAGDQSVWIGQLQILPPIDLINGSELLIFEAPEGDRFVAMQADQGALGVRFAVVDFGSGKVFGTDAVPPDRISGLPDSRDTIQLGWPVAWSPDGALMALILSPAELEAVALVVDLSSGAVRRLAPDGLPDRQWGSVNLDTLRRVDERGTHAVDFEILGCRDDDCYDFGQVGQAILTFDGSGQWTDMTPGPHAGDAGLQWLQLASRRSFRDAAATARDFDARVPGGVQLFQSQNGYYAIAAGPFTDPSFDYATGEFVERYDLPRDAQLTAGARYVRAFAFYEGQTEPEPTFMNVRVGRATDVFLERAQDTFLYRLEAGDWTTLQGREGDLCQLGMHEPAWTECRHLEAALEAPVPVLQGPRQPPSADIPAAVIPFDTAESTSSAPPDRAVADDLAAMWAYLEENAPPVAAATRTVVAATGEEVLKAGVVEASYVLTKGLYTTAEFGLATFVDPDVAVSLYVEYLVNGGAGVARTLGTGLASKVAENIAVEIVASFVTDEIVMADLPPLSDSMQKLVRAGVKASMVEAYSALRASTDRKEIAWLVFKRAYEMVEIYRQTRGLAGDVDEALIATAMSMQSAAQITSAYRQQENVRSAALSALRTVEDSMLSAVGRDDAEAATYIFRTGYVALTALFDGDLERARQMRDRIVERGNADNVPTLWNAPDLLTYLANGFTDSPRRAAEIMIGVTALARLDDAAAPGGASESAAAVEPNRAIGETADQFNVFSHVFGACAGGCDYDGVDDSYAIAPVARDFAAAIQPSAACEMVYQQAIPTCHPTPIGPDVLGGAYALLDVRSRRCNVAGCAAALVAVDRVESDRALGNASFSGAGGFFFDYVISTDMAAR